MNREEIRERILTICGVDRASADFNVGGFHMLCDELERLEREACANYVAEQYGWDELDAVSLADEIRARSQMNNKPSAWMQELPKEEGVERAVRTTTVKEVANDWENPIPLFTADDLRAAVLAEREACAKIVDNWAKYGIPACASAAVEIRARGEK